MRVGSACTRNFKVGMAEVLIATTARRLTGVTTARTANCKASIVKYPTRTNVSYFMPTRGAPSKEPNCIVVVYRNNGGTLSRRLVREIKVYVLATPATTTFGCLRSRSALGANGGLGFFNSKFRGRYRVSKEGVRSVPVVSNSFLMRSRFNCGTNMTKKGFFVLTGSRVANMRTTRTTITTVSGIRNMVAPFPNNVITSNSGMKSGGCTGFLGTSAGRGVYMALGNRMSSSVESSTSNMFRVIVSNISRRSIGTTVGTNVRTTYTISNMLRVDTNGFSNGLNTCVVGLRRLF